MLGVVVTPPFTRHPDLPEGLAKLRAAVVNMRALAEVGRTIGLGDHLYLGRGEETTGGRDKDSILADAVEAVIGAVYITQEWGGGCARAPPDRSAHRGVGLRGAGLDWKTSLQELLSQHDLGNPTYQVDERTGARQGVRRSGGRRGRCRGHR